MGLPTDFNVEHVYGDAPPRVPRSVWACRRLMVDVETMSLRPDAAIIQIGAVVVFQDLQLGPYYENRIDPRRAVGSSDIETAAWWRLQIQGRAELARVWGGVLDSIDVAREFAAWVRQQRVDEVWAKGPQFDCEVLKRLFEATGVECPWEYRQERDLRTLLHVTPEGGPGRRPDEPEHDALADARYQARQLVAALSYLR